MKETTIKVISLVIKILAFVTGLSAYAGALPEKWLVIAGLAFGAASILKDFLNRVGDLIDDGKENNSFKL